MRKKGCRLNLLLVLFHNTTSSMDIFTVLTGNMYVNRFPPVLPRRPVPLTANTRVAGNKTRNGFLFYEAFIQMKSHRSAYGRKRNDRRTSMTTRATNTHTPGCCGFVSSTHGSSVLLVSSISSSLSISSIRDNKIRLA